MSVIGIFTSTDWRENSNLLHQIETYFDLDLFLDRLTVLEGRVEFPTAHSLYGFFVETVSNTFFDFYLAGNTIGSHSHREHNRSRDLLFAGLFAKFRRGRVSRAWRGHIALRLLSAIERTMIGHSRIFTERNHLIGALRDRRRGRVARETVGKPDAHHIAVPTYHADFFAAGETAGGMSVTGIEICGHGFVVAGTYHESIH